MNKKKLLVFMMTYNNADSIEETLRDLSGQRFKDFKLVIVDDCSKDDTRLKIKEFEPKFENLTLIINKNNLGVLSNLYESICSLSEELKSYQYFHWACPDDNYDELYFQKLINCLDSNTSIAAVQSHVKVNFVNLKKIKITQCESIKKNQSLKKIFFDEVSGRYQPYNQFIHGIIRAELVPKIYQIDRKLFDSIIINELFIVALYALFGEVVVYNEVLHVKNISESFEIRNPYDSFTIKRGQLKNRFFASVNLFGFITKEPKLIFSTRFYLAVYMSFRIYFWAFLKRALKERYAFI